MDTSLGLLVLFFSRLFNFTSAFFCTQVQVLPFPRDCRAIIAGIDWVAAKPHESHPRAWGRRVQTTWDSEQLPKIFYIEGRNPPNTCAVQVDVDPWDYFAVDTFTLRQLGDASKVIYRECLVSRGKLGEEYPSGERHVWAKLVTMPRRPHLTSGGTAEGSWGQPRIVGLLGNSSALVVVEGALPQEE